MDSHSNDAVSRYMYEIENDETPMGVCVIQVVGGEHAIQELDTFIVHMCMFSENL